MIARKKGNNTKSRMDKFAAALMLSKVKDSDHGAKIANTD
jgi:hypothetical protein